MLSSRSPPPPFLLPLKHAQNGPIKQFIQATNVYRDYNYKGFSEAAYRRINNIGEITFDPAPTRPADRS